MTVDLEFIKKLPLDEQKEYLKAYLKANQLETKEKCSKDFLEFIRFILALTLPGFKLTILVYNSIALSHKGKISL